MDEGPMVPQDVRSHLHNNTVLLCRWLEDVVEDLNPQDANVKTSDLTCIS